MVFYNITHLKDELGTELADSDLVMTSGCYDIFHLGHVCLLEFCAKLGDMLIVVVNGDSSVKELKGKGRPIQMAAYRANVVEACGYVDHVLVWESSDIIPVIHELEPRYWVKGNRKFEDVLETDAVMAHGGDVVCYWNQIHVSTTYIVGKIIAADHAEQVLKNMRAMEYNLREIAPDRTIGEPPPEYEVGGDLAEEGSSDEQVERIIEMPLMQLPVTPHDLRVAAHCLEVQMAAIDEKKVATFTLGDVQLSYTKGGDTENGAGQEEDAGDQGPEPGEDNEIPF